MACLVRTVLLCRIAAIYVAVNMRGFNSHSPILGLNDIQCRLGSGRLALYHNIKANRMFAGSSIILYSQFTLKDIAADTGGLCRISGNGVRIRDIGYRCSGNKPTH